jgi:hypothetical protein
LPASAEREEPSPVGNLERAEYAELHTRHRTANVTLLAVCA